MNLTKRLLTRATSKAVGTTLKTNADKTKLIPLKNELKNNVIKCQNIL